MLGFACLVAGPTAAAADLSRGPYLQICTPEQITVCWRTAEPDVSIVRYGASADALDKNLRSAELTTEHRVTITGLTPDTKYYYSIGGSGGTLAGGDDFYFVTHPVPGTDKATRVWIIGDSGTGNRDARAVRDAYVKENGGPHCDVWLMLGDNAYTDGKDVQYQVAVFDTYPEILRNTVLWPTIGNHDGHSVNDETMMGPYYSIFEMPTKGEAGGVPSGSEAYYSFDYGTIHFVCLDSEKTPRQKSGAMARWLKNDLSATKQEWVVVYFHHPPYSKGSHDSDNARDSGGRLRDMRENFVPILEDYGVDIVYCGHSHAYERSKLINGHHGLSSELRPSHIIDGKDGKPDGDGPYVKAPGPQKGAVFTVAGSSGKISGGRLNHPVMVESLNELGSVILDVKGKTMDARFINSNGEIRDHVQIKHADPAQ